MAQRQPPEAPDEPTSKAMEMMNDPRVSAFLRFFNAVLTGVTLAAVLGLAGAATSWQANNQRMGWLLEQLSQEVKQNTLDNNKQQEQINDLRIEQGVMKQTNNTQGWRINRLEHQNNLNR
jgi:type VI protein secretion system component VasK